MNEDRFSELRRKAEEKLRLRTRQLEQRTDADPEVIRLMHELGTHQIELEMQNEELLDAQLRLKEAARKYTDLYDFA
ncbi:MAG: histidine kinase, partial [Nitrospirae bacterium]